MATPTCAGAAAIVRQYYAQGYHVSGTRNDAAGINPSGALVKATMINSGTPVRSQTTVYMYVCVCMYLCTHGQMCLYI